MPIPLLQPSVGETVRKIRRRVSAISGVKDCEVRMDSAGKKPHVRLRVFLDGDPGYERIHGISSTADHEVRRIVPNARVSIRSEPEAGSRGEYEGVWALVKRTTESEPGSRGAHNIHLHKLEGKLGVDFHLEVSAGITVKQAHDVATRIERRLKAANPEISDVVIHAETTSDRISNERLGHGTELRWYIEHVVKRFPEAHLASRPVIRWLAEGKLRVIIHVSFSPDSSLDLANKVSSGLEAAIRDGFPKIVKVDIVNEPSDQRARAPSVDMPTE